MPTYRVTRDARAVVTVHASTAGAAFARARRSVREARESLSDDVAVRVHPTRVYEHPSAPFEPFRVSVEVGVTVSVDADDETGAREASEECIETVLDGLDLDEWKFVDEPAVERAGES